MFGTMLVFAITFVWMERKVSGRIQDRLGPTRVGGKFGWLQTLADGVKLLCKEDSIPGAADHFLFRLAPYLAVCGSFVAFLALPFGNGVVGRELGVAVFFMLAVLSSEVFGVILAGYGSGSKWSLFGGIREAAQVVSYEVPRAICVLIPVIVAGSLNLSEISRNQTGFFTNWYVFHDPFCFLAFLVFVLKCWVGIFIMMWVRWTLPRLRIDQVMLTCLKYLLPMSFVLLLGVGVWELAVPYLTFQVADGYYFSLAAIWKYGIAAVSV